MLSEALNKMEGVTCARPQGALYLFPKFSFPKAFLKEARRLELEPDTLYALELLRATGIVFVFYDFIVHCQWVWIWSSFKHIPFAIYFSA